MGSKENSVKEMKKQNWKKTQPRNRHLYSLYMFDSPEEKNMIPRSSSRIRQECDEKGKPLSINHSSLENILPLNTFD